MTKTLQNKLKLIKLASHLLHNNLFEPYEEMEEYEFEKPPIYVSKNEIRIAYYTFPFNELPHIFKEWIFDELNRPVLVFNPDQSTMDAAMAFFDLRPQEFLHCFCPFAQYTHLYYGKKLPYNAKKQEVAMNLFWMVDSWSTNKANMD